MKVDSFEAVKAWLEKNGHDWKAGDIEEIRPALTDIHERLAKVRCISPTTDLTDRMWMLMERAGLKVKRALLPCKRTTDKL